MLATLIFSTTYRCPIECDLCGLSCNPRRKERLSLEFMREVMDEFASFHAGNHVTFTGGEPFILGNDLLEAVRYAHSLGMTIRIVSNGFWGRTLEKSEQKLAEYQAAGLTELNISVDDFHQKFIPLQNVLNIHTACVNLGLPIYLAHKALRNSKITIPYLEKFFGHELYDLDEERAKRDALSDEERAQHLLPKAYVYGSTGCIPVGTNSVYITDEDLLYRYHPTQYKLRCGDILRDVVISATGGLDVCCGVVGTEIPELTFTSLKEEGLCRTLQRANDDLFINWLALEGPYGIMKYVQAKNPAVKFRDFYMGPCHLCLDVFTLPLSREVLREIDEDKIDELTYRRMIYDLQRDNSELTNRLFKEPID